MPKNSTPIISTTDLQGYYPLHENTDDQSGNDTSSTSRKISFVEKSSENPVAAFTTSGAYLQPSLPVVYVPNFSVAGWIYLDNYHSIDGPAEDEFATAFGWLSLLRPKGKLVYLFAWADGSDKVESNSQVPLGTWTHVSVTYQRSENIVRIYINGNLDKKKSPIFYDGNKPPKTPPPTATPAVAAIGGARDESDSSSATLNGYLCEIYLYTRQLSAAEVSTLAAQDWGQTYYTQEELNAYAISYRVEHPEATATEVGKQLVNEFDGVTSVISVEMMTALVGADFKPNEVGAAVQVLFPLVSQDELKLYLPLHENISDFSGNPSYAMSGEDVAFTPQFASQNSAGFDSPPGGWIIDNRNSALTPSAKEFSIAGWVNIDSFPETPYAWLFGGLQIDNRTQKLKYLFKTTSGRQQATESSNERLQPGKWAHVALTYSEMDNRTLRYYVNGHLDHTQEHLGGTSQYGDPISPVEQPVGGVRNINVGYPSLTGYLAEVYIFLRVLSGAEIQALAGAYWGQEQS